METNYPLIPFPPSVNAAYSHFRDNKEQLDGKSPAVLDWNGKFWAWTLVNRPEVTNAKNAIQTLKGLIGMKFAFKMQKQRLFTLKGTPKKLNLYQIILKYLRILLQDYLALYIHWYSNYKGGKNTSRKEIILG